MAIFVFFVIFAKKWHFRVMILHASLYISQNSEFFKM